MAKKLSAQKTRKILHCLWDRPVAPATKTWEHFLPKLGSTFYPVCELFLDTFSKLSKMCTPFVSDFSYSGCKMCIPLLGRRFGFRESFFRTVQKVLPRFGGRFLDWPVPQAVFFLQCFWGIHFWAFFAAMCCRLFCGIFGWRVGVLFSLSWNRCCARVFCGLSRVLFFEVFPNCLRGLLVVGSRAAGQTHAALLFFFFFFSFE